MDVHLFHKQGLSIRAISGVRLFVTDKCLGLVEASAAVHAARWYDRSSPPSRSRHSTRSTGFDSASPSIRRFPRPW